MTAEVPRVAVTGADSGTPALTARTVEGGVELASYQVGGEEMPFHVVVEPVACFGLYEPVFPLPPVRQAPPVVIARQVEAPFSRHFELDTEVGVEQRVVKQIGLYRRKTAGMACEA